MQDVTQALQRMGVQLPEPNKPAGNYTPFVAHQNLVSVSGQTAKRNGVVVFKGKVGRELDEEQAREAASLCAINLVSQLHSACKGDWSNFVQCLKLNVFINCTEEFDRMPSVADGVSNLMVELFGQKGVHSRSAIGVNSLPGGSAIEVDGLFIVQAD